MDPAFLFVIAIPLLIVAAAFALGFLMRRERKEGLGLANWRPPTRIPGKRTKKPTTEGEPKRPHSEDGSGSSQV